MGVAFIAPIWTPGPGPAAPWRLKTRRHRCQLKEDEMKDNLSTIDEGCVADGYVFANRTYRYLYVGQRSCEKPQWLKQNPDKWRRIEDVEREAASPAAPVESEVIIVAASS